MAKLVSRRNAFIQRAIRRPGSLSRQLGIPIADNIPTKLLRQIEDAKIGQTITNSSASGKRRIPVTRLLKRRVALAQTLRSF